MCGFDVSLSVPSLRQLHARRSEKWAGYPGNVLVSTIAEMDFPLAAPVATVLRAAIDRHDLGYAYVAPERLRHAFVGFADRRLGWTVDADQITLVPDVMTGIVEVARMLTGPHGTVAFASPAYPPFFEELPLAGLRIREIPMLAAGCIDFDAFVAELAAGTRVVLLANPHNPTGRVLSRRELEQVADACAAYEAWVIADEIHAPLVLPGATHTPWLEVSDAARERGVCLISASKAFNIAGLKAALLVTASERGRQAMKKLPPLGERAGLLGVLAAEAAFECGDVWLDAVIAQLAENRALLAERLHTDLPDVVWTPPQATYLAWLDFRRLGLGDDPAGTLLRRGQVALSPGLEYGSSGAGFARLNFGTSAGLVAEIVDRIAVAVDV